MPDEKLKIKRYTLDLGFRSVAEDNTRDIVPYHEIGLVSVPDDEGKQTRITIEFWRDLAQFSPTELGFYTVSQKKITIKAPISEFERAHNILRSEKPVFFEFNKFNVVGGDPDQKSITAASITTGKEPTGEGPRDRSL